MPHRRTARVVLVAVALALAILGRPPSARAADPREKARELASRGYRAFKARRFDEAKQRFQAADDLHHAPTILLWLARCHRELDELDAAERVYRRIVDEPLAPDAPAEFVKAHQDAEAELTALLERRRAEEQPHDVVKPAPTIEPEPATPTPRPPPVEAGTDLLIPAAVALSLGGAGLIVGAVAGGVAIERKSTLDSVCTDRRCSPSDQSTGKQMRTAATVSTVGFVVGGVAAAAGVVLIALHDPGSEQAAAALHLGPASLSLEGRF
jgi:tetratricopeptide (TPR) repeat protein